MVQLSQIVIRTGFVRKVSSIDGHRTNVIKFEKIPFYFVQRCLNFSKHMLLFSKNRSTKLYPLRWAKLKWRVAKKCYKLTLRKNVRLSLENENFPPQNDGTAITISSFAPISESV